MATHIYQGLLLTVLFVSTLGQEYEVVKTPVGKIRGLVETRGGEKVYSFKNIPYAKPPVGDLRFRKPQPYGSWDYTLDATTDDMPCVQEVGFMGMSFINGDKVGEDCLILNVYVPRDITQSKTRAVMVWIHGGGFTMGQGSWYDCSPLALKGDVIVVSVNYRLGVFGFLSTGDQASPGNYGLWDQRLSLEWVKSNIAAFGGNPSSITIFGESAGGMSVSFQSIIPYNKGLFQRVIAQSGSAAAIPLATGRNDKLLGYLSTKFNCETDKQDTHALVECLRRTPAHDLHNVTQTFTMEQLFNDEDMSWTNGPVVDGDMFQEDPGISFSDKNSPAYQFFNSLDYMAGTTNGEGSILLMMLPMWAEKMDFNSTLGVPTKVLCDSLTGVMAKAYFRNAPGVTDALCGLYKIEGGDDDKIAEQGAKVSDMGGDLLFVMPAVKTLLGHKESERKTYQYLVTREYQTMLGLQMPDWYKLSPHGADLAFLFNTTDCHDMFNVTVTEEDFILEDRMLKYWTNFAKFGDPNGESLPRWSEYGTDQTFLELGHKISSGNRLFEDRMKFLIEEIPKIIEKTKQKHEEL